MRNLAVFNTITLDGYFVDADGGMRWAYNPTKDPEWDAFVEGNARGSGILVFGRLTYQLMASFWPTPAGINAYPVVAERMNSAPKVVFSRTLGKPEWNNTTVLKGNPVDEIRSLKNNSDRDLVILGSGSIVRQLAPEGLIDEYQIVIAPVVLGGGKTMFDDIKNGPTLKLVQTRSFANGNVFLRYDATNGHGS